MTLTSPITYAVVEGFLQCKYLGALRLAGDQGESEYLTMLRERRRLVRSEAADQVQSAGGQIRSGVVISREMLLQAEELLLDARLIRDEVNMEYPGLQRVRGGSALGSFHYVPVLFSAERRLNRIDRQIIEVLALLLEKVQGMLPRYGILYSGTPSKARRVLFPPGLKAARDLLHSLRRLQRQEEKPPLLLNDHCSICECSARCRAQAVRDDNISLLRGLGQKTISAYARRGILTLTQLAHTFRPRRRGKRSNERNPKRYHALQALALRDHRVYVLGSPTIPDAGVTIYLDLEGVPEQNFVYLIGMIVCHGAEQTAYSFWADNKDQEREIFEQFLDVIASHGDPTVITYGGYERAFIKRMRNYTHRKKIVDGVLNRLVNLLGIVYDHFYFPTYANGLKDIGRLLGCQWSEEEASGIKSLVWRQRWESSGDNSWKTKLLGYNQEDCASLRVVTKYLREWARPSPQGPPIAHVQELDRLAYTPKWGATKFASEDFIAINSRAYFDYQQKHVFVRTNRRLKKRLRKPGIHRNRLLRANKCIELTARQCPACKSLNVEKLSREQCVGMRVRSKRSIDLSITAGGIHRRVLEVRPVVCKCATCGHTFKPEKFQRLATHGHSLMSWAMHGHIAHRLSYGTLEDLIGEYFGLAVTDAEIHSFKGLLARYYRSTYANLMATLRSGSVLYIDETEVRLRTGKGYVWIFAGVEEAVYMSRPSREGEFLRETLKDFKGVIVSDFYAAYDGLDCPQQKCLIHLIRDLNQLLLANPFNLEVQSMTERFGTLLRGIVATIDEHGLKRRYLRPHRREVEKYFDALTVNTLESEAARAIRDRLVRYRRKLFTFLEYDDVAWNNNHAENAIKQFAYYRDRRTGVMTEEGLRNYLVLLSLYQTCRYKGLDFLRFLLSGKRNIEEFAAHPNRPRDKPKIPVYPKGFTLPHWAALRARQKRENPDGD
jgi:predicted RecB family nuclease